MEHSKESLEITRRISDEMEGKTFHHHYHILYDIINSYPNDFNLNYVEIGCYAGGSASLVAQRKNTNIFSIDLGNPISPEIPIRNVNNFNIHNNQYEYIMGNSQEISTLEKLKTFINEIDVLFIDGDHTSIGVKNDFELYSPLVKNGGYIIFDDYNDHQFSPEVKPAVDHIVSTLDGYDVIGTLPNTFGARPESMTEGNCFVLKKNEKIKLSIVIPTYYRKDGTTVNHLTRALDSVFNQTYQNFKIYLIGDRYENIKEINKIVSKYDQSKLTFVNLEVAKERDFYTDKWAIWSYGGVNATNYGIDLSMSEGNYYICHLDHDDYWSNDHLETIKNCIEETNSDWICTKSKYVRDLVLPRIDSKDMYINFVPVPESLIHSSVCMNFKTIPLKYIDLFNETGFVGLPADAELWQRSRKYILENNLKSTLINKITCFHIEEGYERK